MKKKTKTEANGDLRSDYDFSKGVRGKYAKRYAAGSNVVRLAPDVATGVGDSESDNRAHRGLIDGAGKAVKAAS
jgi:hypothetical protein